VDLDLGRESSTAGGEHLFVGSGMIENGMPGGGKAIGMLERAFAYGGVLVGHPEAAALVVAVKSVARFPEFRKESTGRRFAEYFLVGTLVSIGLALGVGYLMGAALQVAHQS
jgi:hypothetical protein